MTHNTLEPITREVTAVTISSDPDYSGAYLRGIVARHKKVVIFASMYMVAVIQARLEDIPLSKASTFGYGISGFGERLKAFSEVDAGVLVVSHTLVHGWRAKAEALIFTEMAVDPYSPEFMQACAKVQPLPEATYFLNCSSAQPLDVMLRDAGEKRMAYLRSLLYPDTFQLSFMPGPQEAS